MNGSEFNYAQYPKFPPIIERGWCAVWLYLVGPETWQLMPSNHYHAIIHWNVNLWVVLCCKVLMIRTRTDERFVWEKEQGPYGQERLEDVSLGRRWRSCEEAFQAVFIIV